MESLHTISDTSNAKEDIFNLLDATHKRTPFIPTGVDLRAYVDKLFQHAVIIPLIDEGKIVAMISFYCNDNVTKRSFITAIAISPDAKGRGMGRFLLGSAISYMQLNGFEFVDGNIFKSNVDSLNLSRKFGFYIVEDMGDYYVVRKDLKK